MTVATPAPRVIIVPATIADVAGITIIGRETFKASFGHSMGPEDMQTYLDSNYVPEVIESDMLNPSNTFIVAREQHLGAQDDRVIGFLQLKRGTTEPCLPTDIPLIEIHRIYIMVQFHGHGAGKLLVEEAHRVGQEENFAGIWLGVWEENIRAEQFYRRQGYERVGHHSFVIGSKVDRDNVLLKRF